MNVNVRGALGTQIIELFYAMAFALENGKTIEKVKINVAGDVVPTTKLDWLSQVFVSLPFPIEIVQGSEKQSAWTGESFQLILKHRRAILEQISFQDVLYQNEFPLVHVRAMDRQLVSKETYVDLIRSLDNPDIIGDDDAFLEELHMETDCFIAALDPVKDWYRVLNAKAVYGSLSSFTISTLLIDPSKKLMLLPQKFSDGPHSLDDSYFIHVSNLFGIVPFAGWIKSLDRSMNIEPTA
jgi:hypothetical protein